MITLFVPFRVRCDAPGCQATAMGTCAQEDTHAMQGTRLIELPAPALPEGWTLTYWHAHRCPAHKDLP